MSNDAGLAGVKFAKEEGGILCPSEGLLSEFKIDLTTDTGTSGSFPSTGAPVWIKEGL